MTRPTPTTTRRRWAASALVALAGLWLTVAAPAAGDDAVRLRRASIALPGAPAALVPADLDGDGVLDLVVAVAYTEWDQIGITEVSEMDQVAGLVEVMTIVPALLDRRELWWFRGVAGGGYEAAGPPLPLGPEVLSVTRGPEGWPVVAITDDGVAAVLPAGDGEAPAGTGGGMATPAAAAPAPVPGPPLPRLRLEPLIADRPVLAGSGAFVAELALVEDFDGDGRADLLLPADDGAALYLASDLEAAGAAAATSAADAPPSPTAAARLPLPSEESEPAPALLRHYPLPRVADVDGDGLPDLLFPHHRLGWERFWVLRNLGGGRFSAPLELVGGEPAVAANGGDAAADGDDEAPEISWFGDLDGSGRAEYVTVEDLARDDDDLGMRQELAQAKVPPFRYRIHRAAAGLAIEPPPLATFDVEGYAFAGSSDSNEEEEIRLPGGFQDLDGDGRQDLVTITLDFSVLQAVRILATRSISIGMDFHVWCQDAGGAFRRVGGLDLSGKFRLDLDDLKLGRLSQFAGDFDGDGRADFLQMGRGRNVTLHLGRPGCVYPSRPDARIELEEEPADLGLVRVLDLDGDRRSDLLVVQPQRRRQAGETTPVRLDLYLSAGGG